MKKIIQAIVIATLFLPGFQLLAQEGNDSIKYSEEILEEPQNKNVKWVPRRKGHYNMGNFQSMLKIGTTPLYSLFETISYQGSSFFIDIGYEQKIPKTQLSFELRLRSSFQFGNEHYDFYRGGSDSNFITNSYLTNYVTADLVGRYYLFKKQSISREQSGDNLYGLYILGGGLNLVTWQKDRSIIWDQQVGFGTPYRETVKKGITSGPVMLIGGIGYQQKILKKAYVDLSTGLFRYANRVHYGRGHLYLDLTVGYSIFSIKP